MAAIPARTSVTTVYDRQFSLVAPKFINGVADQVFNDHAMWRVVSSKFKRIDGAGSEYYKPVNLATGVGESSYKDLDTINTHRHDTQTIAKVDSKEYFEQIAFSFRDRDKIRGPLAAAQNHAEAAKLAMNRLVQALDTDAVTDGTGNSSKRLLGLASWVAADPTTGTVAGINRANVSAWANQYLTNANGVTNLLLHMREVHSECQSGMRRPDVIVGNEAFERALEGQYSSDLNHNLPAGSQGSGHSADGALSSLFYKGIPVVASENWTQYGTATGPGQCVFLNTGTWSLIHANSRARKNMIEFVPEQRSPSQTAMVSGLRFHGELFCDEPRRNGVIFNIGADA
jgi:hypothetical protein